MAAFEKSASCEGPPRKNLTARPATRPLPAFGPVGACLDGNGSLAAKGNAVGSRGLLAASGRRSGVPTGRLSRGFSAESLKVLQIAPGVSP